MEFVPMPHTTPPRWLMLPTIAAALLPAVHAAEPAAYPVEDEPTHRTVLQNPYVQVFRVTLPPGESNAMHVHSHDDAAVFLSAATISNQALGEERPPGRPFAQGTVSVRENGKHPLTHRVHNVGTTVFDVLDVQILQRPAGPAAPAITQPVAEHDSLRVYRYELPPGNGSDAHTHARPYVVVAATDMTLRTASADKPDETQTLVAGNLHWAEPGATHTLTNVGTAPAILVEIELK
jgi:quercetin dioxygenase-like cupin family protein